MINTLPFWKLTDKFPSQYDSESATAIEMVAKVYAKMNELVKEYNEYVESLNNNIEKFKETANNEDEIFRVGIRQEFQDFIDIINLKQKEFEFYKNEIVVLLDSLGVKIDGVDTLIDEKIEEAGVLFDNKLVEVDNALAGKLTQYDNSVTNKLTQYDNSVTNKLTEFDNHIVTTLTECEDKVDEKVLEANSKIKEADEKIAEINSKITEAEDFMKSNISGAVANVLNEAIDNGEMEVDMVYDEGTESLFFGIIPNSLTAEAIAELEAKLEGV